LRWAALARAAGLRGDERLLVALSGGADSVLLLHLVATAEPRPRLLAVHVDHGLRGEASRADARFCAGLCRALGVPLVLRNLTLDPSGPSLEARAREARYRVLLEVASQSGHRTLLTGHHADDGLETLLMRWLRGSTLAGLPGPRPELCLADGVRVVRPLRSLRRAEIRRLLADRGLAWREDASNADLSYVRNRVRHALLPELERLGGERALENLRAFGLAVEALEDSIAEATAHIAWSPLPWTRASRAPHEAALGGWLARAELMCLDEPLRRRALARLVAEGTAHAPRRALLELVLSDLAAARCTRHALSGGWSLWLRSDALQLLPPARACTSTSRGLQRSTLFPDLIEEERWRLSVPGIVTLPDGRRLSAERVVRRGAVPRGAHEVELDAARVSSELTVRLPRPGDRLHPLGAPGSKRLVRFLADRGLPREERARVLLVCDADRILWVAGIAPSASVRVRDDAPQRVRLTLHPH
jgi:tRNA(Ile)-lysidine synthase